MVNASNPLAASLFGGGAASAGLGVGADLLSAWASARAGVGVSVADVAVDPNAPLAPVWTPGYTPGAEALIVRANDGKAFFDTKAKLYADLGATGDYKRLFALHTGLATLQALAGKSGEDSLSATEKARTLAQFARGLEELKTFFAKQQFDDVRLAQGDRVDAAQTTLALPSRSEDYVTPVIHKGGLTGALSGLDANAQFDIVTTSAGGVERRVAIDLSEMNSIPRSLGNVVGFINSELSAAGVSSRLEVIDQTPKTTTIKFGGQSIETRYTGLRQYALKVDVRASETVAFEPVSPQPAFYVLGQVGGQGGRLIKLEDVGGEAGQPQWLARPGATVDPIGANVSAGWFGPGAPYGSAPVGAYEQRSGVLESDGPNNFEDELAAAGEAVLKLSFADGRTLSVSTAWRAEDLEAWRVRPGESDERARLNDLAERLTQLLHEQGVAAGVDVWEDGADAGLSVFSGDFVTVSSLSIGGRAVTFEAIDPPGMVGGLRDGVFARRFSAADVIGASDLFVGEQTFSVSANGVAQSITIDGGDDGLDATALLVELNAELRDRGVPAAASFVDNGGLLTLQLDGLHGVTAFSSTINDTSHEGVLAAPGAWASGGLPLASAGQPFGDALRTRTLATSPLLTYTDALEIEIIVATPAGAKSVSVEVSAVERANDPDLSPGQWSATFAARLDQALNAAGVYVSVSSDLTSFVAAEGAGHRIQSITINGDAQAPTGVAPSFALGGAFSAERSFTSAQAATGVGDDVPALVSDQNVSLTFSAVWGDVTVSAPLEAGDPRTLESAALRLNEALAGAGYDLGVEAVALAGGGAGLRLVSGGSHTIRGQIALELGGEDVAVTLDPIDSGSAADDPVGALRVSERAARGAAVTEAIPSASAFAAPSAAAPGWFPGRAFDIAIGGGQTAIARAVAAGGDGSVYVLADLAGDSATSPIKGARDVALLKYDSAGALQYTRILGAAQSASGFALAVSGAGKIAIAGAVEGALSGAGSGQGGTDSFVALYDADGEEQWVVRRGASANDEASAVAFAPDGSVIVAGKTESALGPTLAAGKSDGYVRGYSASGLELFTKQFGTSSDDAARALLVRDDGAGGVELITGGVENNRGVLRRFSYSPGAGFVAGAVRDIGYFHNGAINAIVANGSALYVGGAIGADRLTLGGGGRVSVAGQEGFVARLDADLVSTALDRASYLGSAGDDSVRGLAVAAGALYATGVSGGVLAGQGASGGSAAFLARLDETGEVAWARNFNAGTGTFAPLSLAVDASGASPLDALGLPQGVVAVRDGAELVGRSALREGDHFSVGAYGARLTQIRIDGDDTLADLANRISRALGAAGRAKIVKSEQGERIEIVAAGGRAVRLEAGAEGRDGLAALGLSSGVIASNPQGPGLKTFGLGLIAADLKLETKADLAKTKAELSAAVSIVRQAYDALLRPNAKPQTPEEEALEARRQAALGKAPEYLTAQLANYRAALARLGG